MHNNYQKTNAGFSVAQRSVHSSRNVEPSSMCRSDEPIISAIASARAPKRNRASLIRANVRECVRSVFMFLGMFIVCVLVPERFRHVFVVYLYIYRILRTHL